MLRLPRSSRPGPGVGIGNGPLARGIVFAVPFNEAGWTTPSAQTIGNMSMPQDIVSPVGRTLITSPGAGDHSHWIGSPLGVAYYLRNGGSRVTWEGQGSSTVDKLRYKWSDDLTIFFLGTVEGGSGGQRNIAGATSGGAFGHAWDLRLTTGNVLQWNMFEGFGPTEVVTGATTVAVETRRARSFAISRHKSAGAMRLYLDGREDGSSTSLLTGTVESSGPVVPTWNGYCYLLLMWKGRALTGPDILSLHQNPWQVFAPLAYSFALAGVGGNGGNGGGSVTHRRQLRPAERLRVPRTRVL